MNNNTPSLIFESKIFQTKWKQADPYIRRRICEHFLSGRDIVDVMIDMNPNEIKLFLDIQESMSPWRKFFELGMMGE